MTIKTNLHYNFTKAENDLFSWTNIYGETITHKTTGRQIYQMHWLDDNGYMAEKVEGDVREQALKFFAELSSIQDEREAQLQNESMSRILAKGNHLTAHEIFISKMDDPNSDF